ncbi:transcription factor E2F7 [Leptodactylus fuscus]|uniref:transcription factor E2F7 n=1 Tax=Leptodactylus fuscus TaxID=238119 RepID=UPI003F4E4A92
MEITGCLTLKDLICTKKSKPDQDKDARSSQKENMCDRMRISPRVPLKGEPIDLSKQKGLTPERYPITPVKAVDRPLADPWTPTANLKMLSSVASPEIRDREKKKELFRPIENNEQEDAGLDVQQFETVEDLDELEKRPSRKQKSLGLLCQKFLARYPSYPISTEKTTISLDEAASGLGVERRRIYDIVNVLESLNLVSRVAKNQYCWHGQHNLNVTLKNLQREGERQKYNAQIAYFQHQDLSTEQRKDNSINSQSVLSEELAEVDCPSASASSRKDKSLRIMSQKFVMLFLVSTTKIITLEIAAKILIEESQDISDHSKFKTKVRRLYDIANVLTSLGLIKKVHVTEERGRKPAFKWIGPVDFKTENNQEVATTTLAAGSKRDTTAENIKQQKLLRHSSFNHIQSINTVKRKVCSEPSSPRKAQEAVLEHNGYASKMAHLAAICRQKIEEDSTGSKSASNPALGNVGHLPFSVVVPVSMDSDYCTGDSGHQKPSVSPNSIKSQLKVMASSNVEYSGFLPNQPYMYVPSTSVFMLCGNPGTEKSIDALQGAGSLSPSDQKNIQDADQPAKRQRIGSTDNAPLPLVVPKACSSERSSCDDHLPHNSPDPCKVEILPSALSTACQETTTQVMVTKEQEPPERAASAALPQYLYVPSPAGLNGFNFFLPANQTTGALSIPQNPLPHLNVPYVMVPSTALAAFPFICSPAVSSSVTAASNDHTLSTGSMNYSLPGVTTPPPPHIMFGTPSVPSPPIPEPSPDLQQSAPPASASSQSASPVTGDSVCVVQPLPVKNQKSPTPLTPKSMRPVHKDTFFKTPGSLGVSPALRKNERSHARNSSSAQRRLDICNTTDD